MRKFVLSAIAVSALSAPALAGFANTVEASRVGYGLTRMITLTGSQAGGTFTFPVGQFIYNFRNGVGEGALLNGDQITFCMDLAQDVEPGYSLYTINPVANGPVPGPAIGAARAQAIADVWAAAAGQHLVNADYAAAMQMLVWDIAYDYNGSISDVNVGNGNVQFVISQQSVPYFAGVVAIFDTLKSSIGSGGDLSILRNASNGDNQDQLVFIPAPSALALLGLGGLAAARRRRNG